MKRHLSFLALILSVITVATPFCTAAALYSSEEAISDSLDFSIKDNDSAPRAYISPSDLLSALVSSKDAVKQAELDYLDGYFDEYLIYSALIPDSLITVESMGSTVKVSARAYSYTASNGKTVTYLPTYFTAGGVRFELVASGDVFVGECSTSETVRVYYTGSLSIPRTAANRLLNFVYNEAISSIVASSELAEYNRALNEYREYLEQLKAYEEQLEARKNYIEAKRLYDEAVVTYEKYLKELSVYEGELLVYNTYLSALDKYNADMELYKQEYAKYESNTAAYTAYIANLGNIKTALIPIESIYLQPDQGNVRDLYSALQNEELVAMFEKYQGLLTTSFGVKAEDIKYMREYSDRLNELLRGYNDARELSEEEAFRFYKANYAEICRLFNGLYDKMKKILNPTIFNIVCAKMELEYGKELGEYKKWRIKNVLCHIYLVCLCLDDTKTAESTWLFYDSKGESFPYYYGELLSSNVIITDTNKANPETLSWLSPVSEMIAPVMPKHPEEVKKPIEPMVIKEPTEPVAVDEPTKPVAVDEPTLPESFDRDLLLRSADIITLVQDKDEPLTLRTELSTDISISVELYTEKAVSGIAVYNRGGEVVRLIDGVFELSAFSEEDYEDTHKCYAFVGWSSSPFEYIEPKEGDSSVYPYYNSADRKYKITFNIDGRITEKEFLFGELPTYSDINSKKESDELYDYTLTGFDSALRRVDGDFTYTALYDSSDRIFYISFVTSHRTLTEGFVRGSTPSGYPQTAASYIVGNTLYEFEGWDKPLSAAYADTTYTATYKKTVLVDAEGSVPTHEATGSEYIVKSSAEMIDIQGIAYLAASEGKGLSVVREDGRATLKISFDGVESLYKKNVKSIVFLHGDDGELGYSFRDASGSSIFPKGSFRFSVSHGFSSDKNIEVMGIFTGGYYLDDVDAVAHDGVCEIVSRGEVTYKLIRKFSMSILECENGNAYIDKNIYAAGDTVRLNVAPNIGYYLSGVTVINQDSGERVELSAVKKITVPDYDCYIECHFLPIEYTVTYVYHGGSESVRLTLGEMPTPPKIALSFTEDGYYYSFTGWSPAISIVSGDATYVAQYYKIEEELKAVDDGSAVEAVIDKYVVPAVAISLSVLAIIIFAVAYTVRHFIYKKKKKH